MSFSQSEFKSSADISPENLGVKVYLYDRVSKVFKGFSYKSLVSGKEMLDFSFTDVPIDSTNDTDIPIFNPLLNTWKYEKNTHPLSFEYFKLEFSSIDWDFYDDGEYYYFSILHTIHKCGIFPDVRVHKKLGDSQYLVCSIGVGGDVEIEIREYGRVLVICRTEPFDGRLAIKY